jgi:3-phosphoshikimate 1-carboxyvinyltransferase
MVTQLKIPGRWADPLPMVPVSQPLRVAVRVPGSKSLTNRALLLAALADGVTTLTNALESDDSTHVLNALTRLGFTLKRNETQVVVHGLGGHIPASHADLFIGNAGTAARFLTPLLALGHGEYRLDGDARMRQRPIGDLLDALTPLGVDVTSATGCPPLMVRAAGLPGGSTTVAGDVSSQFLSGLLMAAPYARSPLEIRVTGDLNSKPYVDMTLAVMADFGVAVERAGYARFYVPSQRYRPQAEYAIESDASAASYFFAAPLICGGAVRVEDISRRSKQGDMAFLDVLTRMGAVVSEGRDWIEVASGPSLQGVEVDLRDLPDTAQTLAVIAPFAETPTTIRGIASARVKETDRVAAMCSELARLGVSVTEHSDGLTIQPCRAIRPAVVRTYNDHRMAMAFALLGLRAEGVRIENPACVAKTFPDYFRVLDQMRQSRAEAEPS